MTDADTEAVAWHRSRSALLRECVRVEQARIEAHRPEIAGAANDVARGMLERALQRMERYVPDAEKRAAHHTRAADAIEIISLENEQSARLLTKLQTADDRADALAEENARLRAAIESVEQLQRWANEMTHYHKGEWVLYADVIAALRKPDAAGGDDAK